jgi:hypothetical protein
MSINLRQTPHNSLIARVAICAVVLRPSPPAAGADPLRPSLGDVQ